VGSELGVLVGVALATSVGCPVVTALGAVVERRVDPPEGDPVGKVGATAGPGRGNLVCGMPARPDGASVLSMLGLEIGSSVGFALGTATEAISGRAVGPINGRAVPGSVVGNALSLVIGLTMGLAPGVRPCPRLGTAVSLMVGPPLKKRVGIVDVAPPGTCLTGSLDANETLGLDVAESTGSLAGLIVTIPDCGDGGNGEASGCSVMLREGIGALLAVGDSIGKPEPARRVGPDVTAASLGMTEGFALGGVTSALPRETLGPLVGFPSSIRSDVTSVGSTETVAGLGGVVSYSMDATKPGTAGMMTSTVSSM
jgi:hypothetical protein